MKTQKNTSLVGIFTALAVFGLLFTACPNGDPPPPVPVTGVTLDISNKALPVGEGFTLTATVEPSNATNKVLSWSSSDTGKATVANGVVTAVAPGDATITVITADGSFEATCDVTVTPMPTSIEVDTSPDKTKILYKVGEEFDFDGLVVTATYEGDYDDDEIDIGSLEISGFDSATAGEKTITVTYIYDSELADTFTVTVLALTKIKIKKSPDIVAVGEPLDFEEIEVEATWGDDNTEKYIKETVEITVANISGFNKDTAGSQTVTVTYEGKHDTFDVLVLGVTGIRIDTQPAKTLYKTGEAWDATGLVVKATYSDGEERTVEHSALHITGFNSATAGDKTITVSYGDEEATFTVTVIELSKIEITSPATKTRYAVGEQLDITGLVVKATWGDDSTVKYITETVTITAANITGFNSTSAGTKTLTINYGGKTASFTVAVYQQLAAPSNLQTSGTLTWSAVNNASSYKVDINGTEYTVNTNSYSLSSLTTPGTYPIKVKAIGNGTTYTDSEWSPTINYVIKAPSTGLLFTLINNNTAYSVARGTATGTEIVIPPVYNGLPVTTIATNGFQSYAAMTSVIIPNSVTSIGDNAFRFCSGLTSITIPNSVTSIGSGAFSGCSKLESITIPFVGNTLNGTTNTSFNYIFNYSIPSSLETVIITGGSSISGSAFNDCSGLMSVTIPDSVTSIGNYAFWGCSNLTSVIIPNSVTSIGDFAFYNCTSLTRVFYGGANNAAWSGITISSFGNSALTDATRYYYSVTNPGTPNTHWRYVSGFPMAWGATAQQLAAPSNLQINSAILTWSAMSNVIGYTVDIDGTEYPVAGNSYVLSSLTTIKTYMIKVKAIGNGVTYTDSEWSPTVQYTVTQAELVNLTDFGAGAVIKNIFNVATTAEWNTAVSTINDGLGGGNFIINITANFSIAGLTNMTYDTFRAYASSNLKVSIRGTGQTLTLSSNGSIMRMSTSSSHTIILRDLTLMGQGTTGNDSSLVHVQDGNFIMYDVKITGNNMASYRGDRNEIAGGGVYVSGGTLTMNGGEISGNRVSGTGSGTIFGGGVYVQGNSGRFIMNGGKISNNYINNTSAQLSAWGCGVFVRYGGTFIMNDGIISGNTYNNNTNNNGSGGGVSLYDETSGARGATFRMINGTIYGNTETDTSLRNTASYGAALFMPGGTTATYGPSGTETNFTTTNNTIRVENGNRVQ